MGNIFNSVSGLYPELDEISRPSGSAPSSGHAHAPQAYAPAQQQAYQTAPQYAQQPAPQYAQQPAPQYAQQPAPQYAQQPAPQYAQQPAAQQQAQSTVASNAEPAQNHSPLENNRWMRSLNKITSSMLSASVHLMESGGVYMFAGAHDNVGNTTVSYYTARLLSANGGNQRALFITLSPAEHSSEDDSDLLTDLLAGRISAPEAVASFGDGGFHHLTLELGAQLLQAPVLPGAVEDFLAEARKSFRWVIIDSPPLGDAPSMFPVARAADGLVVVARAGVTRLPALNALGNDLEQLGANVLGVILNYRRYPIPQFLMKLL